MYRTTMMTPIGELELVATETALREVHFPGAPPSAVPAGQSPVLDEARGQLGEYFAGDRLQFDLPIEPVGTAFQVMAWKALCAIPFGATISYGEQARRLGDGRKARAVGAANGRNPLPIIVPCHRVVGANGHLTGFGGGMACKAWLLEHEQQVLALR
jgi:methylated-DNA-[protein]-cysteine S-methyltransferase